MLADSSWQLELGTKSELSCLLQILAVRTKGWKSASQFVSLVVLLGAALVRGVKDTETSITAPPVPFCKRWRWQHVPVQLPRWENRVINSGNCSGSSEISQTSSFSELSWSLCLWAHCVLGNRCVTGKGIASVHPSAADTTICCSIWGCWNLSSLLHGMLQLRQEPGHKQQEN